MAVALIADLHGTLLRRLSDQCGVHFSGLELAARVARKRGLITDRMAKKVRKVDAAFNVARHITVASCREMLEELDSSQLGCSVVQEEAGGAQLVGAACDVTTTWGTAPNLAQGGTEAEPTMEFDMVLGAAVEPYVEECVETYQVKDTVSVVPHLEGRVETHHVNDPGVLGGPYVDGRVEIKSMERGLEGDEEMQASQKLLLAKWQARMAGRLGGDAPREAIRGVVMGGCGLSFSVA